MNATLLAALTDSERLLVSQTETAQLAELDEDAAVELQGRIRSARNKYSGLYRRDASTKVAEKGGRGKARPENTRARMKAEAFEDALSRVSRRVATLARQAAVQLRTERISAVRAARGTPVLPGGTAARRSSPVRGAKAATAKAATSKAATGKAATGKAGVAAPGTAKRGTAMQASAAVKGVRTPASQKRRATTKATGARRQAKRDSRG
jgi:hypothetical protein